MAKRKRPTQRERIIQYMKEKGSIDRLTCCTQLFIFELSSRIVELERMGWVFDKSWKSVKNSYGETKSFVEYRILKEGHSI